MNLIPFQLASRRCLTRMGLGFMRLSVVLMLLVFSAPAFGFVITRTSSPIFYIDTSITPTLQGMYVSYQIRNDSGVNYPDIWVRADSFGGGIVSLAPGEDGLVHLGTLAAGQTKTAFFYLQAVSATAAAQTHTVRVYPSPLAAGQLASASFSMTVEETIQALANKVVTVVTGPNPPQLGGVVTMTVTGQGGTIGAAGVLSFSPAAYLNWRPDAYELVLCTITLSGGNVGTYNDQLMIVAANKTSTDYTAVYQFRAVNTTATPTAVSPISFISSGAQIKHTTTGGYGTLDPIQPANNVLTLGKSVTPGELFASGTVTYTLFATNNGAYDAMLDEFIDTLPAIPAPVTYVSASSKFNGAQIPEPVVSGASVIWAGTFTVPAGTVRTLTFQASIPNARGSYTNLAIGQVGAAQIDTTLNTADNAPSVAVLILRGLSVSGFVYNDVNRNLQQDAGETGTGLPLFAKLVPGASGGPAIQAAVVTNSSGAYSFTNVNPGTYRIVVDDNNNLTDVTPTIPAGWIGTEQPTQIRNNVLVIGADVTLQNFGLANGRLLTGRVFNDNGAGGGTANDGAQNGAEVGLAGAQVQLTDAAGTGVYGTTVSDAAGNFIVFIPASLAAGTPLKVVEVNPSGYLSTGGSAGTTGGTYDRASDTTTFLLSNTNYQGLLFGDVAQNRFLNDSQQTGLPGSFVLHSHTFVASSAGQLTFSITQVSNPAINGWNPLIYLDANCNGQLEAADLPVTGPLTVVNGQTVCILIKDAIPITAPFNAQHQMIVSAQFQYSGANPALSQTNSRVALTIVGNPSTAGLTLTKAVDKQTALPGETITYTLTYANTSSAALSNIVIFDSTPAFTTFLSATAGLLPGNLTAVSVTSPAVGSAGSIRWNFTGALAPGQSGTVSFRVVVSQ